jgi:hypothetical protein
MSQCLDYGGCGVTVHTNFAVACLDAVWDAWHYLAEIELFLPSVVLLLPFSCSASLMSLHSEQNGVLSLF